MARRKSRSPEPILELNRWQATGVLLGLGVIAVVVFLAGVVVGRHSGAPLPAELARIAAPSPAEPKKDPATSHGARSRVMADVWPGTGRIDADLARPLADVVPRDPTDAARVEAHRQLLESRAAGLATVEGAQAPAAGAPQAIVAAPGAAVEDAAPGEGGYALQVSAFEARAPAALVAGELREGGHETRLREVRANGRKFWRVEVGHFDKPADAQAFQRRFERSSGYSTILVTVP